MTFKVRWVNPATLKWADFNPLHRTDPGQLKDLMRSMQQDGFHEYQPILLAQDGTVGDGHRRLATALALKLAKVPVIDTGKPLAELYGLNTSHLSHKPRDWMEAYFRGLQSVPAHQAELLHKIERVVGRDGLALLVEYGLSPNVYNIAVRVTRYLENPSDEFTAKTLYWLVEHNQATVARLAVQGSTDPSYLRSCIMDNRPLMQINTSMLMPVAKPRKPKRVKAGAGR